MVVVHRTDYHKPYPPLLAFSWTGPTLTTTHVESEEQDTFGGSKPFLCFQLLLHENNS